MESTWFSIFSPDKILKAVDLLSHMVLAKRKLLDGLTSKYVLHVFYPPVIMFGESYFTSPCILMSCVSQTWIYFKNVQNPTDHTQKIIIERRMTAFIFWYYKSNYLF